MKHQKTVVIGLSGGVDSSVAAFLLKKQGFKVIGLFMQTFRDETREKNPCKSSSTMTDEKMARLVAKMLKIKLIIRDYKKDYYSDVIKPMIKDYQKGLTPNPDISCNKLIKFPYLLKETETLGADYIATGHYARIKKTKEGYHLLAGKDKTKDQSYFLYQLDQKTLAKTLFPLGSLTKEQVRKIAKTHNFPNWNKPGTTGICFLGKTPNIKSFLEHKIKQKKGKIVSPEGKILGSHPGSSYFTIGQKIQDKLGLTINKPRENAQKRYYITEKRKGNILVAAPEGHSSLLKDKIIIKNLQLIAPNTKIPSLLQARIRHLGELHPGTLRGSIFALKTPIEGLAPGQSIVLYHKDEVIGGGEIS